MPPGVYDKDGFKPGPNGGVFPDTTANLTDNDDFENWDWKQIRAAVVGYAATSDVPTSTPFADPNSIRKASNVFNRARAALDYVSDSVRLQTEALAGENGAWKSPAADAFRGMNLLFAAKLNAKAEQINGGEVVGTNNVPAQLWESGNYLQWAQETIQWIDSYYAAYVRSVGVTMSGGLARISDYPELVTQMGDDMKKVVRILAAQYVMNTSSVTPPNPSDFDTRPNPPGGGGDGPPDLSDIPPPPGGDGGGEGGGGGGGGGGNPPPLDIPPPPGGEGGGGGGGTGGGNGPGLPPPLDVGGGPGGGGGGGGPQVNAALPPPLDVGGGPGGGGGGTGGGSGPGLPPPLDVGGGPGGGGPGGGGTGGGSGPGLPPPLNVGGGPGGGGAGGGTGGIKPPPSLAVTPPPGSGGGTGSGTGGIKPPPSLAVNAPPGSGGTGGGGTGGGGTGGIKAPPALDVNGPPGSESGGTGTGTGTGTKPPLPNPADWQAPGSGGSGGTGGDRGGAGMPPPMMPPGGGQPGGSGAERPDSSGLLGGVKAPWQAGSPPPVGDPGLSKPPAVKPEDWAAPPRGSGGTGGGVGGGVPTPPPLDVNAPPGSVGGGTDTGGVAKPPLPNPADWQAPGSGGSGGTGGDRGASAPPPMMPPGGMGGGQPGGAGSDRPDSSGLLGGVKAPWEAGAPSPVGGPSEVPPPLVKPEDWAAPPSAGGNVPGAQVPGGSSMPPPMMPPGGMGGGQPGGGAERPDSSGLLGGEKEPWEGLAPPVVGDPTGGVLPPVAKPEDWATPPGVQVPGGPGGVKGSVPPPVDVDAPGGGTSDTPPGVQVPGGGEPPVSGVLPPVIPATPPGAVVPGQQSPGGGQSPMMPPPGGMGGGQPGGGAERPDSSGLLGGLHEPWTGAGDVGKVGGNSDLLPPSATPESWANTPADTTTPPASQPVAPMMPPPMAPGTGTPGAGAERPDSSALLGGDTSSWEPALPPIGTDQVSNTPAAPSAPWAATPGEQVVVPPTGGEQAPPTDTVLDPRVGELPVETPAEVVATPEVGTPEAVAPEVTVPEAVTPDAPEFAEEIDLTPAAAPAGWAASSDVVPATPGVPSTAATAAVLGASVVTAAAVLGSTIPTAAVPPTGATPPGTTPAGANPNGAATTGPGTNQPHGTEFAHVDGDGVVEDEDGGGGALLSQGGEGPVPGIDSVVVVRPDDAVPNTSAWDTGTPDFLLPGMLMPFVVAKSDKSSWETEETSTDIVLKSTEPWEPEPEVAHTTYRRRKAGEEASKVVDTFVPPLSCGDEFSIPEDGRDEYLASLDKPDRSADEDDEDPDAEPEEKSAADLLNESGSAWGGSKVSRSSGVLE